MTLASDSITVTDQASGVEHATVVVSGKHYPVVMLAGPAGHLYDTLPTYYWWSDFDAGAANERLIDLFNASGSGKIVRIRKIFVQCNQAAITGVGHIFMVSLTSAAGTSGATITGRPADTTNSAIPAQITARHAATGGATESYDLFAIGVDPEETRPGAALMGMINWVPEGPNLQEITLREGEGIVIQQVTSNTAASWGCLVVATLE